MDFHNSYEFFLKKAQDVALGMWKSEIRKGKIPIRLCHFNNPLKSSIKIVYIINEYAINI